MAQHINIPNGSSTGSHNLGKRSGSARASFNTLLPPSAEASLKMTLDHNRNKDIGNSISLVEVTKDVKNPEKLFQNYTETKIKNLFESLRKETDNIERNIAVGESEVLKRDELAFLMKRHDLALSNLQTAHSTDLQKRKDALEAILVARSERKKAKRDARKSIRSSKRRDQLIQQQKASADAAARIRETIGEKRSGFDALTQYMYDNHEKQRKNLVHSQERKDANEKLLVDLETRHLKEEVRGALMKKFQVRQSHLSTLNKRINDNLREVQLMELRHSKERFELEMVAFEEIGSKRILHENQLADLRLRHQNEMHNEKEAVLSKKEAAKESLLARKHAQELKQLAQTQRIEMRQLRLRQDEKVGIASSSGSRATSKPQSKIGSKLHSRAGSNESLASAVGDGTRKQSLNALALIEAEDDQDGNEGDSAEIQEQSSKSTSQSLVVLKKKHREELKALEDAIKKDINDCNLSFDVKLGDMEEAQNDARINLIEAQERELEEVKASQEKEILIEEMMHDSEMKMLIERRILNSVLQTVADGIINITPGGIVTRFNHAAEIMFGWSAAEVIGQNISMLMPERYGQNHDTYLQNYLNTGIKHVIGTGRRVAGLKKNGKTFPLHLSISELKEDGEHMFTGIARDLTEEIRIEEEHQAAQDAKQKELELMLSKLDVAKQQADNLLSQMLPPSVSKQLMDGHKVAPQSFKCATIFFLDVVGFTTISSQVQPLEIVSLLNSLYSIIDWVIDQYDVYKVETIGDSYMIVSGLPVENDHHASEIATMSLHLGYAVDQFVYKQNPKIKIKIRMGINTGSVVAGCVGTKMPRYCLFGDTVNTASRMESNSAPGRINCSEATANLLKQCGKFELESRGEIDVKGKGKMNLYWVNSKLNFDPSKIAMKVTASTTQLANSDTLKST